MPNRRFLVHFEANNVVNPHVLFTTLRNFGIDKSILINTSGQKVEHPFFDIYGDTFAALNHGADENGVPYSDYKKVYLKPPESIPGSNEYKGFLDKKYEFSWLKDYMHPEDENVLYVIGPDQYTLPIDMLDIENGDIVAMEITKNSLWSIVAAGIVSRDAYMQDKYGKFVE